MAKKSFRKTAKVIAHGIYVAHFIGGKTFSRRQRGRMSISFTFPEEVSHQVNHGNNAWKMPLKVDARKVKVRNRYDMELSH